MEKETIKTTGSNGRYLYAVVPGSEERVYGYLGINGGNVYTIAVKDVAAVVSDVPHQKIRPERRHFAAHQAVLKRVMLDGDLLPMSFGVISQGPKAVKAILSRNNKSVQQQLKRISGKAEMGIKVTWDVPNIFEYFITVNSELREARNKLVQPNYLATQQEKIEIGRMFEEILNLERERHTKRVERVMSKRCSEIKRSKCRVEIEVMHLSCLVDRALLSDFEAGVLEAASHFDDSFAFDFNGPWAPHNFVDLEIDA